MAHRVDLDFHAALAAGETAAPRFRVTVDGDAVRILGGFSTGKGRWQLSASAVRHRRRLTLQVLARPEAEDLGTVEVQDHAYRATLRGLAPGPYQLRVTHVIHAPELGLSSEGLPAWEAVLEIAAREVRAVLPASGTDAGVG